MADKSVFETYPKLIAWLMIFAGIIVAGISQFIFDHHDVWVSMIEHAAIGFAILGGLSLLFDMPHFRNYFEERLGTVLGRPDVLEALSTSVNTSPLQINKLDYPKIAKLHTETHGRLVRIADPERFRESQSEVTRALFLGMDSQTYKDPVLQRQLASKLAGFDLTDDLFGLYNEGLKMMLGYLKVYRRNYATTAVVQDLDKNFFKMRVSTDYELVNPTESPVREPVFAGAKTFKSADRTGPYLTDCRGTVRHGIYGSTRELGLTNLEEHEQIQDGFHFVISTYKAEVELTDTAFIHIERVQYFPKRECPIFVSRMDKLTKGAGMRLTMPGQYRIEGRSAGFLSCEGPTVGTGTGEIHYPGWLLPNHVLFFVWEPLVGGLNY